MAGASFRLLIGPSGVGLEVVFVRAALAVCPIQLTCPEEMLGARLRNSLLRHEAETVRPQRLIS
jgi:hypothetical protein